MSLTSYRAAPPRGQWEEETNKRGVMAQDIFKLILMRVLPHNKGTMAGAREMSGKSQQE
jgi:hypothetical protein